MDSFVLHASGDSFDVESFLEESPLVVSCVWHKGTVVGSRRRTNSGLEIDLAQGRELQLAEQDHIAARFLEVHEKPVSELGRFAGVSRVDLVLHRRVDLTPHLVSFYVGPSRRLMEAARRTDVSVSFLVELVRPNE